jgi:hypothetical protein
MFIPNRELLQDYSANKPTLPAIGAAFGSSAPYANYVLLGTVPADQGRQFLSIQNLSTGLVVLVLDDGTTAVGSVPTATKATVESLAAASVAGGPGGGVYQDHFQGRVQIYAPSAAAQVAAFAR